MSSQPPSFEGDWYFEAERDGFAHGVHLRERILEEQTPFQHMEIVDSEPLGRALILDRALQTSLNDEFMYHEMIVHVPLVTHQHPDRVLVIGGGDGGTLRRVLQHPVKEPTQVEIDRAVVDACKAHLPEISDGAFDNPRARLVIGDGVQFMRDNPGGFDVVIVDSTDPIGPAVQLFQEPFYRDVARSLADDGLMVAQSSSPLFMADELSDQVKQLRKVFPIVRTYLGIVTGYPGGLWSYTIGSKRYDPTVIDQASITSTLRDRGISTRYYSGAVHHAAFALPPFIADLVA
ncbi:MAG: Polyamine aminopropyltransferase [Chloroflexi bacterium]|nr:Polyamine aminopropyltransferase [Chloroflexota bacterium]